MPIPQTPRNSFMDRVAAAIYAIIERPNNSGEVGQVGPTFIFGAYNQADEQRVGRRLTSAAKASFFTPDGAPQTGNTPGGGVRTPYYPVKGR